jgi:hypothetical protein
MANSPLHATTTTDLRSRLFASFCNLIWRTATPFGLSSCCFFSSLDNQILGTFTSHHPESNRYLPQLQTPMPAAVQALRSKPKPRHQAKVAYHHCCSCFSSARDFSRVLSNSGKQGSTRALCIAILLRRRSCSSSFCFFFATARARRAKSSCAAVVVVAAARCRSLSRMSASMSCRSSCCWLSACWRSASMCCHSRCWRSASARCCCSSIKELATPHTRVERSKVKLYVR